VTTENTPNDIAPDTIVLVHGFWVTLLSWEKWVERFEGVIAELDRPPIIIGHSAGGLFTRILLDLGPGAAGVVIDSVPAEGIRVVPVSQIRSLFPFLKSPANRHGAVGFTPEQFHYAFTNTLFREESDEIYERYHVPASGNLIWAGPLANFTPGHQDTYVNFRNEDRAPLLFIAGSEDNIMPPAVNESNVKHYRYTKSVTDYKEFEGCSHYGVIGGEGWEEVADYALEWAVEHAGCGATGGLSGGRVLDVVRTQRLSSTEALDETRPDSRVVTMPGQGHVAIHTAPEFFAGLVVGVLAQERATP
jgi:pimeloyl-ACP methyl ester carboxylesterase